MDYPPWQSCREKLDSYSPREPWNNSLYKIVYEHLDALKYRWDELFFQKHGHLRDEVVSAFEKYLDCGVLAHGCAHAQCENCKHTILIAFSCKRRILCSSCSQKRAILFAENLTENILLPHPHRHLTFTIPKRLRVYFRYDRKLLAKLYNAAWQAFKTVIQQQKHSNSTPAAVMALHTWGKLLNWHPHVHCIALDGVVDEHGQFQQLNSLDSQKLTAEFQKNVFSFLLAKQLIDQQTIDSMLGWEHSGFSVHSAVPIKANDSNARLYLSRYLKKAPIADNKISIFDNGLKTTISYKHDDTNTRNFSPLEFLAQISIHLPTVFEQTTRYYGAYSARYRGRQKQKEKYKKLVQCEFKLPEFETETRPASSSWARCIKRVFEIDPLECPKCYGEMKITHFIHSYTQIKKIADSLGYPTWRAPPKNKNSNKNTTVDYSPEFDQTKH